MTNGRKKKKRKFTKKNERLKEDCWYDRRSGLVQGLLCMQNM